MSLRKVFFPLLFLKNYQFIRICWIASSSSSRPAVQNLVHACEHVHVQTAHSNQRHPHAYICACACTCAFEFEILSESTAVHTADRIFSLFQNRICLAIPLAFPFSKHYLLCNSICISFSKTEFTIQFAFPFSKQNLLCNSIHICFFKIEFDLQFN